MLFNSVQYVLFLPICILVYYILPVNIRNRFLLPVSYFFYMCWNPKYALLLFFSTAVTWLCGFGVEKTQNKTMRKLTLWVTVIVNIGILFLFKYYNFFWDVLTALLGRTGIILSVPRSSLLLPVGISFYTFQALGYAIDVYRGDIRHERSLIDYALFVSFFPQLVAGPIERSKNLLVQIKERHIFDMDKVTAGLRLILLGMFKKIVIADMTALYVDAVFADLDGKSGITVLMAVFLFSIQIYGDFAGYSDVARGTAMTLGIDLMVNFSAPYFSTSIKEFWQRWHISLSTWLKDYIYIPLGGNRKGFFRKCVNLLVVFGISGLWHGASIAYCIWGGVHGVCRVVEECFEKYFKPGKNRDSRICIVIRTIVCFLTVQFAWIFFRAGSRREAFHVIRRIFSGGNWDSLLSESASTIAGFMPDYQWIQRIYIVIFILAVLWIAYLDFMDKYGKTTYLQIISGWGTVRRWTMYYLMILSTMFCFVMTTNEYGQAGAFLYFQF